MLTLIKKIFTWWNQDTFGTRLKTIFFGKYVGSDSFGNKYYESKKGKRWVIYSNEIDASKRMIKSGDKVIVFNDRGSYEGVADITDDVSEGIIVSTLGYWRQHNNGTVNSISSGNLADMGNAPTFSDNLVEIKKV